jgi:hypothetical protein
MVRAMTTGRKYVLGFISVVVIVCLAAVGWHYHLRRTAEQYKATLKAQGEYLSLKQPWPKPLRGDRDKAMAFFQAITQVSRGPTLSSNLVKVMQPVAFGRAMVAWAQPEILDYRGKTNTWGELAEELEKNAAAVDGLRASLNGPGFDFNLYYSAGFATLLPHLAKAKQAAQIFSMATALALHRKQLDLAQTNLLSLLSLSKALHQDRFIISELVEMSIAQIAAVTTWEALQASGWTDAQLDELQEAWLSLDFLEPAKDCFVFERAMTVDSLGDFRDSPPKLLAIMGMSGSSSPGGAGNLAEEIFGGTFRSGLLGLWKNYWSYDDELRFLQITQVHLEALRQSNCSWQASSALIGQRLKALGIEAPSDSGEDNFLELQGHDLRGIFSKAALSRESWVRKTLATSTVKGIVATAIALKRHQMRHGSYPASLENLVPSLLPRLPIDFMDGQTLRYKAESSGGYKLYSVGADLMDGGGLPPKTPPAKTRGWTMEHDWVWPQPATPGEVAEYEAKEIGKFPRPLRRPKPVSPTTTNPGN